MPGKGKAFSLYGTNGPKPPCGKECPDRKAGCAVTCVKWRAYLKERNAFYEKRREEAENNVISKKRRDDARRYLYNHKKRSG